MCHEKGAFVLHIKTVRLLCSSLHLLNSRLQFTNIANAEAYGRRYHHEYTGKSENLSRPDVVCQQACQDKPPG